MRGVVNPVRQCPDDSLKTDCSRTSIPIPASMTLVLSAHVKQFSAKWLMTDESGIQMGPWQMQRAFRAARAAVDDLPVGFRFHDLRHFYASLLISSGLDVKVVQSGLRPASARRRWTRTHTFGRIPMTARGPQSTLRSRPERILRTFCGLERRVDAVFPSRRAVRGYTS
jgi:hypothetical protein